MIIFDLVSDAQFEESDFISEYMLRGFITRLLRYLETNVPPLTDYYCRNAHTRWPGLSILYNSWVSFEFWVSNCV